MQRPLRGQTIFPVRTIWMLLKVNTFPDDMVHGLSPVPIHPSLSSSWLWLVGRPAVMHVFTNYMDSTVVSKNACRNKTVISARQWTTNLWIYVTLTLRPPAVQDEWQMMSNYIIFVSTKEEIVCIRASSMHYWIIAAMRMTTTCVKFFANAMQSESEVMCGT